MDLNSDWGNHLSCLELTGDNRMVLTGFCSSGVGRDCQDNSHIMRETR